MKKHLLLLSFAALAFACQQRADTVDIEADIVNLRAAVNDYNAKVAALDIEYVKTLYAPGAAVLPPGEDISQGTEAVNKWLDTFKTVKDFKVQFSTVDVVVYPGGTSGHSLVLADVSMTGEDGNPAAESIRDYHVWAKQGDGSWKILFDIWNDAPAKP